MSACIVIGQIFLSILAIFGLIFLFRALFDWCFAPAAITVAVKVQCKKDADDLDILLCEAERSMFRHHGIPVMVLISPLLMEGEIGDGRGLYPQYQTVVETHGAVIYMISECDQPSSV